MEKFNFNKLSKFKWFVLENFPFIEADFDALTNWQLFCKLGKEMNKIINSENIIGEQVETFSNAFLELKNYVDDYFATLDVQEEINNKLDEMVEDGTLTNLIERFMNPIINSQNLRIDEIENEVRNVASGSPKRAYNRLEDLINANPDSGIYLVSANGHIYSWTKNGTSASDLGVYLSSTSDDNISRTSINSLQNKVTTYFIEELYKQNKVELIEMIENKNINTGGSKGDTLSLTPESVSNWNYAIVNCVEGDYFSVTGTGGSSPRLWCFVDSNNKIITNSVASKTATNLILQAPKNSSKLIINSYNKNDRSFKITLSFNELNKLIESLDTSYIEFTDFISKGLSLNNNFDIGSHIDLTSYSQAGEYAHIILNCKENDVFKIIGAGGQSARLFSFLDNEDNLISKSPSLNYGTYYFKAPKNSSKVVINIYQTAGDYHIFKKINNVDINNLQNETLNLKNGKGINLAEIPEFGDIPTGNIELGNEVNLDNVEFSQGYFHILIDCLPNEKFILQNVTGGNNPRLYNFLDENNNLISKSNANASGNFTITAPLNARKLLINCYKNSQYTFEVYKYNELNLENLNIGNIQVVDNSNILMSLAETDIYSYINGLKFKEEIETPLTDFKKTGDLMVHVSTISIVNDIMYCTYYANTRTAQEDPSKHTARFVYAPLNNLSNKTFIDLQDVGENFDGKTVNEIYDTILLRKDSNTLYLMWTAKLDNDYYRLYRTFDISSKTLSQVFYNTFKVSNSSERWNITNMKTLLNNAQVPYKPFSGDIGIMQKISSRIENGITYYYTGVYCGTFTCIAKSSDLVTWEFVAKPDDNLSPQWENAVYVLNNLVYYFGRREKQFNTSFLITYNLNNNTWSQPIFVNDCQSRSDFIYTNNKLYLIHAPKDRYHLSLMEINTENIARSTEIQTARCLHSCFYPFIIEYNNEYYISYTDTRLRIYVSKFTIKPKSDGEIDEVFKNLIY